MSFKSFLHDRRGGVAPIFALAIIPVIGLIGAAIDYSRASSIRTSLQAALDATALAMAKSAPTLTESQLQTKASEYFNAIFTHPEAKNVSLTVTYTSTGGSTLTINGAGAVDTTFTRVMGFNQMSIGSSAKIKWGNQRLRVALALDTTGSMSSAGKIDALKTATKSLLDQLRDAASTNGDVYVSLVPFSRDVNVGSSNHSATWLNFDDGTDKSWDGTNGTCSKSGHSPRSVCQGKGDCSISGNNNQSSCTSAGTCSLTSYTTQSTCTAAGACSNPSQSTQSACTSNKACSKSGYSTEWGCINIGGGLWRYGTWSNGTWTAGVWTPATWTPNARSTWNGCVTDRGGASSPGTNAGNDQLVTTPSSGDATTLFYPDQYQYCSPEMMGLNYNWTQMKTAVDNLTPNGSTNQPIGLVWGWQSLVGGLQFGTAPAKDANYIYKEVIIFLSDGLNTQNRWNGDGFNVSTAVDNRMYYATGGIGTCKNIKDAGITIYAIQVNTGGDPESQVMKNCASGTDKFYTVTSSSGIGTVFNQIGTQLSRLRIAQ